MTDDAKSNSSAVDRVMEPLREAGEALKQARQRASEHNETISLRLIDFAERNMADTLEALRAAARAKDVGEVLNIQGNFLREQLTRGVDQFREIAEMVSTAGRETAKPITDRATGAKKG